MSQDQEDMGRRAYARVRVPLQVAYRSTGSFLMSYSVDLSRGGLFLENADPPPIGTELDMRLDIPGVVKDIRLKGVVVWINRKPAPGKPRGMGIQFRDVVERLGELIDSMVKHYSGLRLLVASSAPRVRAQLVRLLRSCLAASLTECDPTQPLRFTFDEGYDLVVIDLGNGEEEVMVLLDRVLKGMEATAVVAMTSGPRLRQQARDRGAHEVISSPPQLSELRGAVIRALARPMLLQET